MEKTEEIKKSRYLRRKKTSECFSGSGRFEGHVPAGSGVRSMITRLRKRHVTTLGGNLKISEKSREGYK